MSIVSGRRRFRISETRPLDTPRPPRKWLSHRYANAIGRMTRYRTTPLTASRCRVFRVSPNTPGGYCERLFSWVVRPGSHDPPKMGADGHASSENIQPFTVRSIMRPRHPRRNHPASRPSAPAIPPPRRALDPPSADQPAFATFSRRSGTIHASTGANRPLACSASAMANARCKCARPPAPSVTCACRTSDTIKSRW